MQAEDFSRFKAVMTGMAKLYERELDQPLMDAYWLALHDWSLVDFEKAAGHLMATAKFMPRPAEFNGLRKAGRPTAGEAWLQAKQLAANLPHHAGMPQEISSSDLLLDRAVRAIGGYVKIAMTNTDTLHFLERRFAEHYEEMQGAADTREAVPQIAQTRESLRLSGPKSVGTLLANLTEKRV